MTLSSFFRRAGRILGWGALGLVLLIALAVGGAFLFLHSQHGGRWVADKAVAALKDVGIEASIGSLEGNIPLSMRLRDLRLADKDGTWLEVPEASLRIGVDALLHGRLKIREVSVREADLSRLPHLAESPRPEPSDPLAMLKPEALKPLASDIAGALRLVTVDKLSVDRLRLGQAVAGVPLTLTLEGGGPLTDFRSDVNVIVFRPAVSGEPLRTLLEADGHLYLGNEGKWLPSAVVSAEEEARPDVAAGLDMRVTVPGSEHSQKPDADSGHDGNEPAAKPGNETGRVRALVTLTGSRLGVPALEVEAPGASVHGKGLFYDDESVGGDAALALGDPAALLRLVFALAGDDVAPRETLPLKEATLAAHLAGKLDAPELTLDGAVSGLAPDPARPGETVDIHAAWKLAAQSLFADAALTADGAFRLTGPLMDASLPPSEGGADTPTARGADLSAHVEALRQGDRLEVRKAELRSEWLALNGEASVDAASGALAAEAALDAPSLRALARFPLLSAALAASPLRDIAGKAEARATLRREDRDAPFAGALRLNVADMRWGMAQLQDTVGQKASLGLSFSLAPATGALTLSDVALDAGKLKATASASLSPEKVVKAALDVALSSLSGLDAALSGQAALQARLSGPVASPGVDVTLTSPALGVESATLEGLRVHLSTPSVGAQGGAGTLRVAATLRDGSIKTLALGAPLRFDSGWRFAEGRLQLKDTRLDAPGMALSGSLDAAFAERRLEGGFRLNITDWAALSSLTGVPISGSPAAINVSLSPGTSQGIAADWSFASLSVGPRVLSLNDFKGRLNVSDVFGSPNVRLAASLGRGTASDFFWKSGKADISGPLNALRASLKLEGRTAADVLATLDIPGGTARVQRLEFTERRKRTRVGLRLNQPVEIGFAKGLAVDGLDLSILPKGALTARARLDGRALSLSAQVRDVPIGTARLFTDSPVPDGVLDASVDLSGTPARPQGSLEVSLSGIAFPDSQFPPASVRIEGTLQPSSILVLNVKTDGTDTSPATATISLPLAFSASGVPSPAMTKPLSGHVFWEGSLASLWRFVPLANSSLEGQGYLDATLSGTLAAPRLSASIRVQGASFEDVLAGLELSDINASASLQSEGLSRLNLSAGDGQGGAVSLNGTIGQMAAGFPLALHGSIKDLSPLHRNDLSITLSGTADITGPLTSPAVRAALTVNQGQYQIVRSFGTSIPLLHVVDAGQDEETGKASSGAGPTLDVTVEIPNRFFVRGKGLESEWKGDLHVQGAASDPSITGNISSIRGQFGLLGKEFTLSRGVVEFSGATPPDPLLNILVAYNASNITAEAIISGTASSPSLTLTSEPPLPQDEVVAQVLFGKSASSLGRLEALQLAAELATLSGFGSEGFGILGEVRDTLGVDVLRFGSMDGPRRQSHNNVGLLQAPGQDNGPGTGEDAIPSLEVGKYVMDNVYVGLEQGMTGDASGVRVEIELSPRLNLEGVSTPQGSEIGLNWKKDY